MNLREQIALAHRLGGVYDNGRWKFPSVTIADHFRRCVAGLEWTPAEQAVADAALVALRPTIINYMEPMA